MEYTFHICAIIVASATVSSLGMQSNIIDLTNQLDNLKECTITILVVKIKSKQNPSQNYASYNVLLNKTYPTLRFVEEYQRLQNRQSMLCDHDYYGMNAGLFVKFKEDVSIQQDWLQRICLRKYTTLQT